MKMVQGTTRLITRLITTFLHTLVLRSQPGKLGRAGSRKGRGCVNMKMVQGTTRLITRLITTFLRTFTVHA